MKKRLLFVLAAIALVGAGFYVRSQNAANASSREGDIVTQDLAGADTTASVAALKTYVKNHLGASAEFTLTGAFDKAMAAAKASAAAQSANSQVYADAQRACSGKTDSITQARCNQAYLQQHLVSLPATTPVAEPKIADYQYKLRAPIWTPDLAGALFLGAAVSLVLGLFTRGQKRYL
jgi:hypothetical protein